MIFFRLLRKLKRRRVFLPLILLFILVIIIISLGSVFFSFAHKTADIVESKTGIGIGKTFYDFESRINFFRNKKDIFDSSLDVYNLEFSENDVDHFDELTKISIEEGFLDKESNLWRSINLEFGDKEYRAEIKIHGESRLHWMSPLKSFNVKLVDNNTINGLSRFSLLNIEERTTEGRILKILSEDFGLFEIEDKFIGLKINGVEQGFYYLIEKLDKDFLERNACSSCVIIRIKDTKFEDHPLFTGKINGNKPFGLDYLPNDHSTAFDYEISHASVENGDLDSRKVLNQLNSLFDAIEREDVKEVKKYFDVEHVAKFEAIRMLIGNGHVDGDNLRMVYSGTNSKFYFVPWEGGIKPLVVKRGGFESHLNVVESPIDEIPRQRKLFALLNKDDEIRQLKYKKLYDYISEDGFLNKLDELNKEVVPYANSHKGTILGTKILENKILNFRNILNENIKLIKDGLSYGVFYTNVIENQNKLSFELMPDSISQFKIEEFKVDLTEEYTGNVILIFDETTKTLNFENEKEIDISNVVKDFYFSTTLAEDLGTEKRKYDLELVFSDNVEVKDVELKIENWVTGVEIEENDIYLEIANANDDVEVLNVFELIEKYDNLNFKFEGNELTLLKGNYILDETLIIPENLVFNVENGVNLLLKKDVSLISYSPVNIKGVKSSKVVVKSFNKEPFGVFGIVGKGKSKISWLELSGGNEDFVNGIYFSGGLSLYHMDLEMDNVKIFDNFADDGLNVKYSNLIIEDSTFVDNFADQVDLDFVTGVVKNSEFSIEDENLGDGLDLSGSKVLVKNNLFKGLGDKGISVGEKTKVIIFKNKILNNNIGSAVKDESIGYFIDNEFKENEVTISGYIKKILYVKGGKIYLSGNKIDNENFEVDKDSSLNKFEFKDYHLIENENLDVLFEVLNE